MRLLGSRPIFALVTVALGAMATVVAAQVTRPTQGEASTTALLTEVRALRLAIERLASAAPRVQLAFGRLQLQEQRISALTMQLDSVRERIHADQIGLRREQLRTQEQELQQQIATEQARWSEINQSLEELDRVLAAR